MRSADEPCSSLQRTDAASETTLAPDGRTDSRESYDIDSELCFSHPDLVLTPTLSACPDLSFDVDIQSWGGSTPDQLFVSVTGSGFDGVFELLGEDPTVADHELVAAFETEHLYCIQAADDSNELLGVFEDIDVVVREMRSRHDSWTVRAHLSTRSVLAEITDRCRTDDISLDVTHLSELGAGTPDRFVLSAEQWELLTTAIDHGYFETPRSISQHDLARMFDVSTSAISQRLRTAIGTLVAYNLGTDETRTGTVGPITSPGEH